MKLMHWIYGISGIAGLFCAWMLGLAGVTLASTGTSFGIPRVLAWSLILIILGLSALLVRKTTKAWRQKALMAVMGLLIWTCLALAFKVEGTLLALFGAPSENLLLTMAEKYNPNWLGSPWKNTDPHHQETEYEAAVSRWEFYRGLLEMKWEKKHWERLQRKADEKAKSMSDTAGSREAK